MVNQDSYFSHKRTNARSRNVVSRIICGVKYKSKNQTWNYSNCVWSQTIHRHKISKSTIIKNTWRKSNKSSAFFKEIISSFICLFSNNTSKCLRWKNVRFVILKWFSFYFSINLDDDGVNSIIWFKFCLNNIQCFDWFWVTI